MSQNVLTCKLCDTIGGTDSKTCIYKNHITYNKNDETHVILRIKNGNETETINKFL
jgi:hypothetical protein